MLYEVVDVSLCILTPEFAQSYAHLMNFDVPVVEKGKV